ncbi:hypothetical protein BST61_g1034 [Cercospora zeina]
MSASVLPLAHASTVGAVASSDGVQLAYIQAGPAAGQQLLFIPGWRQTAAEWRKQIEYFSESGYQVTAYDHRGHGDSEKVNFGYRVSRLGADLNDVMNTLALSNVSIIAHSMGSEVAWALWDQYPEQHSRIHRFVIVDQPSLLVQDPTWTQAQRDTWSAAIFTPDQTYTLSANLSNELVSFNRKMSDENAATLLINGAFADWRDVLPNIDVPTLVLSGEASIANASGVNWATTQIPGARGYTFTKEERGSHFVFWENPERFNQVVRDFITAAD